MEHKKKYYKLLKKIEKLENVWYIITMGTNLTQSAKILANDCYLLHKEIMIELHQLKCKMEREQMSWTKDLN